MRWTMFDGPICDFENGETTWNHVNSNNPKNHGSK